MKEKTKLTVEMDVTPAQAIVLQEMFKYWNHLADIGSSRRTTFYVDGDGDFRPKCKVTTDKELWVKDPKILETCYKDTYGNRFYDPDLVKE